MSLYLLGHILYICLLVVSYSLRDFNTFYTQCECVFTWRRKIIALCKCILYLMYGEARQVQNVMIMKGYVGMGAGSRKLIQKCF